MAAQGSVTFSATITGAHAVHLRMEAVKAALYATLGKDRLEKFFLERTKMRFYTRGANQNAQRAPDGRLWKPIKDSTLRRRKVNANRNQALVDSGELRRSIVVLSSNMSSRSAMASPTGAGFRIGVKPGSKAERYARIQNTGGVAGKVRIPKRRFLGIGKSDVKAFDDFLARSPLSKLLKR